MQQTLLVKFAVIFIYQGLTAVLPLIFAMGNNNPIWALLIPLLKAGWITLEQHLTSQGLLGGSDSKGQAQVWH